MTVFIPARAQSRTAWTAASAGMARKAVSTPAGREAMSGTQGMPSIWVTRRLTP